MTEPTAIPGLDELQALVDQSRAIVFFGGAGVSTESGVPDFRSQDGLYHQSWRWPPETILSHTFFVHHTADFYEFYREKLLAPNRGPNPAHRALARLEEMGKLTAVITQNIDGLHQAAGSQNVLELHGSVHRNYCTRCGARFDAAYIQNSTGVPHCPCGGVIKPDVVLYEESLNGRTLQKAVDALEHADLLIVGGTSLNVYPAAGLLEYYHGGPVDLINRDETPFDRRADLIFRQPIGQVLGHLRLE